MRTVNSEFTAATAGLSDDLVELFQWGNTGVSGSVSPDPELSGAFLDSSVESSQTLDEVCSTLDVQDTPFTQLEDSLSLDEEFSQDFFAGCLQCGVMWGTYGDGDSDHCNCDD